MGRGGKKKGKKGTDEVTAGVENLTLEPTTSRASESSEPGPSQSPERSTQQLSSEPGPSQSAEASTQQPAEATQPTEADTVDDDGVVVPGRKRVRNRKKKPSSAHLEKQSGIQETPTPVSVPIVTEPAVSSATPPTVSPWGGGSQPSVAPTASAWGCGSQPVAWGPRPSGPGLGRGRGVPPFSQVPSAHRQSTPAPYGQPAGAQAPYGQPAGAPAPYGQPAGAQAPYGQPAGAPAPYGQPAGAQAPYGQPAGAPAPYAPPSGAPAPSVQPSGQSQRRQAPGDTVQRSDPRQFAPGPQKSRPADRTVALPAQRGKYSIPSKILTPTVAGFRTKAVLTNYLPLTIKPIICYRYDVSFEPEKPKKLLPRAFYAMMKNEFPKCIVAYDQMKIMFTVQQMPGVTDVRKAYKVTVYDDNDKAVQFDVALKPAGTVDLSTIFQYMKNGSSLQPPTDAIQCIDVVLRQGTLINYKKAGRAFFKQPRNPIILGDGLEMWTGLFQSAIFCSRPFINIDVAHKGFAICKPLIDHIYDFKLDPTKALDRQRGFQDFKSFVKGLRVVVNIGGAQSKESRREFIVNDIMDSADFVKFPMTDPKTNKTIQMTVETYFRIEKNCRLKYPKLNVLWVGPRNKTIYYPMELATVAYGQLLNRKMTERQTSTMVRQAATPPNVRMEKIEELIHTMQYSKNEYYKHFGLTIEEHFTKVDAKIIPAPRLDYGGQSVEPRNGQWQFRKLFKSMSLVQWGFVGIRTNERDCNIQYAIKTFRNVANDIGMSMAEPAFVRFIEIQDLDRIMYEAAGSKLQLLMVAGHQWSMKDIYSKVKQTAELRIGVLTQCVKDSTLGRINNQTARNILLKVNSKLMGVNQTISNVSLPNCLKDRSTMVVGADVTHSTPDQSTIPSIAAVTASIDPYCYQYNLNLSIQAPRTEVIVDFEDLMLEHLKVYRDRQKALPTKIYVFRDGVSEGQFEQVMNSELRAIYNAYATLTEGRGRPEVMFLLVQKRHHTRMFSTDKQAQNVDPGTVIDDQIVHPKEVDFYLVSHNAIKGTARPTRYHAICNDGAMPLDQIEQLAHHLCHLYSRCTRSVSYPTPTYYAHLACLRARTLTQGKSFDPKALEKNPQRLKVLEKVLDTSRMFFV